ncbi:hypothetical protein GCU60_09065 [Blastococcus saxobsidens]|uniref:Uncharacterized protein n=1 Tax=Blastococcus saxobsidens TaxID=138336 RepID=A0A6L9W347_9ACTN|nr:hypothetical protein [Blastococcus saxobsidens]NEK85911.1 hypothetical protein [Blastococcus saxobsidens]
MTEPAQDRTPTTPDAPAGPSVSTAPAGADSTTPDVAPRNRWWSAVPHHLGRARTSTVVLGVLFVAVFALWLNVRPPTDGTPRTPSEPADVNAPVVPGLPEETEPAETEPAPTTTAPRPTTSAPATTSPSRTSAPATSTTPEPTAGTTPSAPAEDTTDETVPDSPTG